MDRNELLDRVKAGDESAFESLMLAHHHRLYVLAHGILRDPHLAEDATQQAFLDIWRDIDRLRDPARFEAWSYRVLVRVCYREIRRRKDQVSAIRLIEQLTTTVRDPSGTIIERDQLERGFARLSADHRVVIVMRHQLDMSPERIAETLGISRRTVYSRLKRATQALRASLEADARAPALAHGGRRIPS